MKVSKSSTEVETTIVTKKTVPVFVIELTEDEAVTLATVLAQVGGHPKHSRRGHTEEIYLQLKKLGIKHINWESAFIIDSPQTYLRFKDNV